MQVRAADLDGHLYRVETPAGTTVYPSVQVSPSHTVAVTLQGSTLDLTAGRPTGDVLLGETAGVSTWAIHLPTATAVTVHADAGAGKVSLYGQSLRVSEPGPASRPVARVGPTDTPSKQRAA